MTKKTSHARALDAAAIAGDLYRLRQKLGIKEPPKDKGIIAYFRPIGWPDPHGITGSKPFDRHSEARAYAASNNLVLVKTEEVK